MADNDLISRSALLDDLRGCYDDLIQVYDSLRYIPEKQICGAQISELKTIVYWVNNAPAVDAVEVVRCKNCKHFTQDAFSITFCDYHTGHACDDDGRCDGVCDVYEDDFCSYGERRADDGK